VVKTLLHSLWSTQVIVVPRLGLTQVHYHVACGFCVCLVLFIFFLVFLVLVFFFFFSFYLTVSLYVAEVAVVVVMGLQDVQSQNMCRRKKSFYIQIIMKNNGD